MFNVQNSCTISIKPVILRKNMFCDDWVFIIWKSVLVLFPFKSCVKEHLKRSAVSEIALFLKYFLSVYMWPNYLFTYYISKNENIRLNTFIAFKNCNFRNIMSSELPITSESGPYWQLLLISRSRWVRTSLTIKK